MLIRGSKGLVKGSNEDGVKRYSIIASVVEVRLGVTERDMLLRPYDNRVVQISL